MRSVVELAPEPHGQRRPETGYRLEVRDCFHCRRELHVYVPIGHTLPLGGIVVHVPCPHCHKSVAETLIPDVSQPVFVRACQRSRLAWRGREVARSLRNAAAHLRVATAWPYWALYRLRLRRAARNRVTPARDDPQERGRRDL